MGIPRQIGSVRPFAELARGTTTSVLKAHDPASDEIVVVKLLRREWADDAEIRSRFEGETSALRSVDCENVVRIIDHGESDYGLFIVTEFVDGPTLDTLIANRTIPSIISAFIVREALCGLRAVHAAGIVHRDFKAANIVISDAGVVKLMDFGFAESAGSTPGAIAGTMGYLAPELLAGESANIRTDLFAAGVTLLESTTGRTVAGVGRPVVSGSHSVQEANSESIGLLDSDLAEVVQRTISPTPGDRPPNVDVLVEDLDRVMEQYRPMIDRSLLSRWLRGEKQTLPRRMILDREPNARAAEQSAQSKQVHAPAASPSARVRAWHVAATLSVVIIGLWLLRTTIDRTQPAATALPGSTDSVVSSVAVADSLIAAGATDPATTIDPPSRDLAIRQPVIRNTARLDVPTIADATPESSPGLSPDLSPRASADSPPSGVDSTTEQAVRPTNVQSGSLSISASPWAHVFVDGASIGVTPLTNALSIPAGSHRIRFSNPNFPDYERVVDVAGGELTTVSVSMWSTVARLSLTVNPWAEVLIDGVVRDTIPLSAPLILRPGSTLLTLRHPELGSWSKTLNLEADSTYVMRFNLYDLANE